MRPFGVERRIQGEKHSESGARGGRSGNSPGQNPGENCMSADGDGISGTRICMRSAVHECDRFQWGVAKMGSEGFFSGVYALVQII